MTDSEPDFQRLWRDQPRERPLSVDEIRARAQRFDDQVRRWRVTGVVLFAVIVVVELVQISFERNLLERVGDLLTVAAFVYVAAQFRRYMAPDAAATRPATTGSADFYRDQLARHRDMASRPWVFLVPFIPGVGLSLFSRALSRSPEVNVAIALFAVALFAGVAWVHHRTARQLTRELDDLG
jgi:hypothetical protein